MTQPTSWLESRVWLLTSQPRSNTRGSCESGNWAQSIGTTGQDSQAALLTGSGCQQRHFCPGSLVRNPLQEGTLDTSNSSSDTGGVRIKGTPTPEMHPAPHLSDRLGLGERQGHGSNPHFLFSFSTGQLLLTLETPSQMSPPLAAQAPTPQG